MWSPPASCDEGLDYPLALCAFHRQNKDLGTLKDTHWPSW